MIEDADRFGMAQLHQLRGRVGRGKWQSYCIFVNGNNDPCERLDIMKSTNDGFVIAEKDMELRGNVVAEHSWRKAGRYYFQEEKFRVLYSPVRS